MKTEELNRLLEKYYKGESSKEDEKALRVFFNENVTPEGYEAEKMIFGYYESAIEVPEPSSDFETRIINKIDNSEETIKYGRLRRFLRPSISVAAGLLILTGSYFFFSHRNDIKDTYTDPKLAYAETIKILMDVSSKLNEGKRALAPVSMMNEVNTKSFKPINRSAKIAGKNLKNLDYLQKIFEITNLPKEKSINK